MSPSSVIARFSLSALRCPAGHRVATSTSRRCRFRFPSSAWPTPARARHLTRVHPRMQGAAAPPLPKQEIPSLLLAGARKHHEMVLAVLALTEREEHLDEQAVGGRRVGNHDRLGR